MESRELNIAQNHALIYEAIKWFGGLQMASVEQHLVPEPSVQQVQHRVLGTADVQVDGHPLLFKFRIDEDGVVFRIDEAQVVPARSSPLRHGVGFTLIFLAVDDWIEPIVISLFERWFRAAVRFEVLDLG